MSDLAPECANPHDSRYFPERILLYDQHPGGTGMSLQVSNVEFLLLYFSCMLGVGQCLKIQDPRIFYCCQFLFCVQNH